MYSLCVFPTVTCHNLTISHLQSHRVTMNANLSKFHERSHSNAVALFLWVALLSLAWTFINNSNEKFKCQMFYTLPHMVFQILPYTKLHWKYALKKWKRCAFVRFEVSVAVLLRIQVLDIMVCQFPSVSKDILPSSFKGWGTPFTTLRHTNTVSQPSWCDRHILPQAHMSFLWRLLDNNF